jgi:hypothetical protein
MRSFRAVVPILLLLLGLTGCARFEVPFFDNFDSVHPIRADRSYKKEAVRGLKILIASYAHKAAPQSAQSLSSADIITLRKGDDAVCRLYVGEDWIGFQLCDAQDSDWSQPVWVASPLDAEDRRVIHVFLSY